MQEKIKDPDLSLVETLTWEMPQKLTVSEWANKYRVLDPLTSAEPGLWRTDRTPYMREVMDSFKNPTIEKIILNTSTQIAKTECILNCLGYTIDQDPGPTLLVLPTESDAENMSNDRIQPMIDNSEAINSHKTMFKNDIVTLHMTFDRMILYLASAQSASGLASKPIKNLFMDEINKYPLFTGREASPIDLAIERTRTFWNRKIIMSSTPTNKEGLISKEYALSDRRKYYVPCPGCGEFQILLFPNIKWPDEESAKIKNLKLAWYECPHCKLKINDLDKIKMIGQGVWVPDGCIVQKSGVIEGSAPVNSQRGYWINALYSPWLTFSEIASKFLDSKDDPEKLMNFVNSWLAEEWEEKVQGADEGKIKNSIAKYPEGVVPEGAIILTAGVDVQKDHFYFVIRAWGASWRSWLIMAKQVETWADIALYLLSDTTFYYSENLSLPPFQISLVNIDSGYNTDEVYEICRQYRGVARPTKGQDRIPGAAFKHKNLEVYPSTGRPIPGGLILWHIDTDQYKTRLYRWINSDAEGRIWKLHQGVSEIYLKQMTSEKKVIQRDKMGHTKEVWTVTSKGVPNHYLDAEVYATAAAEMLRVYALTVEDEPQPVRAIETRESNEERDPKFLPNTKGWLQG